MAAYAFVAIVGGVEWKGVSGGVVLVTEKRTVILPMNHTDNTEKQVEVVASWAPADPRDRIFDDTATKAEKSASIFRIVAAFHPVLNLPVLFYDSFARLGWRRGILIWTIIAGLFGLGLYFYL